MLKEVSEMLLLQVLFIRDDELFYCVFSILGIASMPPFLVICCTTISYLKKKCLNFGLKVKM